MDRVAWLLLTYKVPAEPAARRIAIWRRLKGMGAVYLQNGVCILPRSDDHLRRLRMVQNSAAEAGGEAVLLESVALDRAQEEKLVARFRADRDEAYAAFIDGCDDFERGISEDIAAGRLTYAQAEKNDVGMKKLLGWLARIERLDFHGGARADEARERLRNCAAAMDDYARSVFADAGRP